MLHTPTWLTDLLGAIRPVDPMGIHRTAIQARIDDLTLPKGGLGRVADIAITIGAIQEQTIPVVTHKALLLFAADHGVTAEGVSAYEATVTGQLCHAFTAGGCVANVLASYANAEICMVVVGVNLDLGNLPGVRHHKVAMGTRNMVHESAATREEILQAMHAGVITAQSYNTTDLFAVGEAGIGNTTAAAAVLCALTDACASEVTGRGTGVGDETYAKKVATVNAALERHRRMFGDLSNDPIGVLASVGGYEVAALAGAILGAAAQHRPILLDGFLTGVAALVAQRIANTISLSPFLLAAHRSAERGHQFVLAELGLQPILELEMRIGEGSGAALAFPIVDAACRLVGDVHTFSEAGMQAPVIPERFL